jgi:adenosyl cobinamide kinase/adenosyl cobinamide phosphate guanylyltransferase
MRLLQVIDDEEARYRAERKEHERDAQQWLAVLQQSEQDARQQRGELQDQLDQIQTANQDLAAECAATADERDRLARTLAEQAVRFTVLTEHGRHLMPLAFAGRAARDIASRLRQHLERVDDFATGMLVTGDIPSSTRPALEQMLGEAAQASALADEILSGVDGQQIAESADCPIVNRDERRS